jgi:hypothetical protein
MNQITAKSVLRRYFYTKTWIEIAHDNKHALLPTHAYLCRQPFFIILMFGYDDEAFQHR